MVKRDEEEDNGAHAQRNAPRIRDVSRARFDASGNEYQHTLPENRGYAVERASYSDERCLAAGAVCQHVIAVGRDVVGGRCKCGDDEKHQCKREHTDGCLPALNHVGRRMRQREREQNHESGEQDLHGDNPPTLGSHHINERTPYPFQKPREIKQRCKERHIAVRHAHLGKHHHRNVVYNKVGHALSEVEGGHPEPGR